MRGGGVLGRVAARLRTEERGLTLIELVVSMSLFAILMSGAIIGLSGSFNLTRGDRSRSVGANLASQEMDVVRAAAIQDFKSIDIGTTTATHTVDGVPYTVKRKTKWVTKDATSGACDGISGARLSLVSVRVTVSWPNMGATSPVTNQTVLTPPVGVYDPETGNIGVKVFDATATGESGVIVHVSGPAGNLSDSTDSEGCAFFGFLTPGAYTVYLNSPGKVDDQGVQNPSQPASVVVGSITSIQFDYDRAATLTLTLTPAQGGLVPANMPATLANTHLLPTGTKTIPGTISTIVIGSLFPFTDGYQAWAGGCLDADPQAQKTDGSGAFYPGASRADAIVAGPGQTTTANVTMPSVHLAVQHNGAAVVGSTVVATHAADTGCGSGESFTLGVTDVSGHVDAALPWGQWTFAVTGKTPVGAWPTVVLNPTVSDQFDVSIAVN